VVDREPMTGGRSNGRRVANGRHVGEPSTMRSLRAITVGIVVGAAACKSDMKRAAELVPNDATVLVGADVGALKQSPLGRTLAVRVIDTSLQEACGLGLESWRSIVFGCDPDRFESTFVFVVSAEGIGTKAKLECLRAFSTKHLGAAPWTPRDENGRVELDIDFGGQTAVGHVVDGSRVVIASTDQSDAVRALIAGEGKPAATHGLEDALARADTSRALWLAAKVPAGLPAGAPAAGAKSIVASVGFPGDMLVAASLAYESPDDASARVEALQRQAEQLAATPGAFGLPANALRGIDVKVRDERLEISARVDAEALTKLSSAMFGPMQ
jgi:hypothetical protein